MSYKWTIDGGNGAIVFANGQQTINTTAPSATVTYVRINGGGYQANLSVTIADPNDPGVLNYGPLPYISCAAILDKSVPQPALGGPRGNTDISATFTPNDGYTIAQAEEVCGYFAFDWQQTITSIPLPAPSGFSPASNPGVVARPPVNDPPPSGWAYQNPTPNAVRIPVYYNIYTSHTGLSLDDAQTPANLTYFDGPADPCLPGGTGAFCNGQTAPREVC
jgi:hypothetical protein